MKMSKTFLFFQKIYLVWLILYNFLLGKIMLGK